MIQALRASVLAGFSTRDTLTRDCLESLANSSFYREWAAEWEEIQRHKWYESEKAGRDVGLDYAVTTWVVRHRSKWLHARRVQGAATPVLAESSL